MISAEEVKKLKEGYEVCDLDNICEMQNDIWSRHTYVSVYTIEQITDNGDILLRDRISGKLSLAEVQSDGRIPNYEMYTHNKECYSKCVHEMFYGSKIGEIMKRVGICENKQLYFYYDDKEDYAKLLEEIQSVSKDYHEVCSRICDMSFKYSWLK